MKKKKIIIFGIGYVGTFLAKSLLASGWEVFGTCRDQNKKSELEKIGCHVASFDGSRKIDDGENFFKDTTHLANTIAPDRNGIDPVYFHHKDDLEKLSPDWFGYLSTTGIYGNHDGAWVDETSETKPTAQRSITRLQTESAWLKTTLPTHIFRLGGIYGLGRNVIENDSQNIYAPDTPFSRIHVADIVRTLLASIDKPKSGEIYNVVDDLPTPSFEVIEYASEISQRAVPARIPLAQANLSPMANEFYANIKRVRNGKIKSDLGVKLAFPTYREGLADIAKNLKIP